MSTDGSRSQCPQCESHQTQDPRVDQEELRTYGKVTEVKQLSYMKGAYAIWPSRVLLVIIAVGLLCFICDPYFV
jgi:hypothetical protein